MARYDVLGATGGQVRSRAQGEVCNLPVRIQELRWFCTRVIVVNSSFLERNSFNHIITNPQSRQISKDAGSFLL